MNWKRLGRALLFPNMAILLVLLPVATVFLVYAMVFVGTESPWAIASYVLAAYTLTVWCCKLPFLVRFFKTFKRQNRYVRRWLEDTRLRMTVSLHGSFFLNVAYAVFQLWLGFYHRSFWFFSLAAYYLSLAVMRFFLLHRADVDVGEQRRAELIKYRACGRVLLVLNLALTLMIFFMVYWNRTFLHHEITTIAMAAYTFSALTMAIVGLVKYRRYDSPVFSAAKAISLAAACVSMLTLTSTMLNTFGEAGDEGMRRILLALTGLAVSAFILTMAVYMLIRANKQLKRIKNNEQK